MLILFDKNMLALNLKDNLYHNIYKNRQTCRYSPLVIYYWYNSSFWTL